MPFNSLAMSEALAFWSALAGVDGTPTSAPLCAGADPGDLLLGLSALLQLVPLASAILRQLTLSGEKRIPGVARAQYTLPPHSWLAYDQPGLASSSGSLLHHIVLVDEIHAWDTSLQYTAAVVTWWAQHSVAVHNPQPGHTSNECPKPMRAHHRLQIIMHKQAMNHADSSPARA